MEGGSSLPAYRLYRLDGVGKIASADWIEADADEAALREARSRVDGHRVELWDGKRLVGPPAADGAARD
jgi:hypothetical protein